MASDIAIEIIDKATTDEVLTVVLQAKVRLKLAELLELRNDYEFWELVMNETPDGTDVKLISVTLGVDD